MQIDDVIRSLKAEAARPIIVNGPSEIGGIARIQGSKNAVNKLVAVTAALPGKYRIQNYPIILDALEMLAMIKWLGGTVALDIGNNTADIDTTTLRNKTIPYSRTSSTTGVFGFAGALLGRFGTVSIGKPGGDKIGPRPVNFHVQGFRALGASVEEADESIEARLSTPPRGLSIEMPMPSVGAVVNVVLAVVGSKGSVAIHNTPAEPDMFAMYDLLRQQGVEVDLSKSGMSVLIDATHLKTSDQVTGFKNIPDRNDAFTFLAYGCLSKNGLVLDGVNTGDIRTGIHTVEGLGVVVEELSPTSIRVSRPREALKLEDVTIVAGLGNMFHSDWAPLLATFLTTRHAQSKVVETLYSKRIRHAEILQQMSAQIDIHGGSAPEGVNVHFPMDVKHAQYIFDFEGFTQLRAIHVAVGYDLRACAAAIMAASQAGGESILSDIDALYRGYEKVTERLSSIGVDIRIG